MKNFARTGPWLALGMGAACGIAAGQTATTAYGNNQTSATNAYYGSVTTAKDTGGVLQLSLDDAIRMGVEHNLALTLARDREKTAKAQTLESLQPLLPTITAQADTGAHQYNLAAQGFSPKVIAQFGRVLGNSGGPAGAFPTIVRVDVTDAKLNYTETLFSLENIDRYRASRANATAAYYSTQSSKGLVVLGVGNAYLQAIAAGAQVDNAQALLRADEVLLSQVRAQHEAGVAANLDELRARVQYQTQQQAVINAQNQFAKSKIALNREIGLPAEQQIHLTEAAPYSELSTMSIEEAKQLAYKSRQDYQGLLAQIRTAVLQERVARDERLPTLAFNGNYGVTGVTRGLYHGTFVAEGSLNLPLFREAQFRGDRDVARANLDSLNSQLADLRERIEQQIRDSMLDLQAAAELVRVARSNVDLAQKELEQTTDRFQAGVEDNLPVVQAQSTLAAAETNLVSTTTSYNQSKLGLARNLGIIDTQYKSFMRSGK